MGLLDLPAPLLDWLDAALSNVITAPGLRLALWGAVGAVLSMALYWALSPQERIARIKAEALAARQRLDSYEGALGDAWPMIGGMLKLVLAPACDRDLAGRARLSAGALPDRLGEHGLRSLVPRRGSAGRGAGFSRAKSGASGSTVTIRSQARRRAPRTSRSLTPKAGRSASSSWRPRCPPCTSVNGGTR
jgi:hypothetical protein